MKKIEHIRNKYDIITEKRDADGRKLETLARSGLFESTKLPILKRALDKEPERMTIAERKVVLELLDSLINEAVSQELNESRPNTKEFLSKYDPRFGTAWPSERDMPTIIILKRKAVRVYPDNQKVGLYYSQYLDRYVSIPFGPGKHVGIPTAINEEKMGVDWKAAYKEYRGNYGYGRHEDEEDDKILHDPAKLKDFVSRKAAEGKISSKHWGRSDKFDSSDERKALGRAGYKQIGKDVLSGREDIFGAAGRLTGRAIGSLINRIRGAHTGVPETETKPTTPSAPKGMAVSARFQSPQTASIVAKATQKVAEKPAKSPAVKKASSVPGTGEQPRTGDFPQPEKKVKTATYSSQMAPARELTPLEKKTGTASAEKQLPRKRYGFDPKVAGTGPQPDIGKVAKPKAALIKKLEEKRQINEAAAALAPVAAAGALAIGAYHAGKHLADPRNRKDIEGAVNAGVQGVKDTWRKASDWSDKKSKEAASERAREAETAAAYDAKKAQIKLQRASERDDAEIAAHSGTNKKNIQAIKEPTTSVSDFSKLDYVAPPSKSVVLEPPTTAAPPVPAPGTTTAPVPVSVPADVAGVMGDAAAGAAAQTRATAGTKTDALVQTRTMSEPIPGGRGFGGFGKGDDGKDTKKLLTPAGFGLKASVSKDTGGVSTGVDKRMQNLYRKSFEKSLKEDRDDDHANTSTSSASTSSRSRSYLTPAGSSYRVSVSAPKSKYRTGIDARLQAAERKYWQGSVQENNLKAIKSMVKEGVTELQLNIGESPITINNTIAQKIVSVHESLSKDNKKKMEEMLNESVESFKKIVSFAVRQ